MVQRVEAILSHSKLDLASKFEAIHSVGQFYQERGMYVQGQSYFLQSKTLAEELFARDCATASNGAIAPTDVIAALQALPTDLDLSRPLPCDDDPEGLKKLTPVGYNDQVHESTFRLTQAIYRVAVSYSEKSEYKVAEQLMVQCVRLSARMAGLASTDLAKHLNNLGEIYRDTGQYHKAELAYPMSLNTYERCGGDGIAAVLNNFALLRKQQGRFAEALPMYLRAHATLQRDLGSMHPDLALSCLNMAGLYSIQGNYQEAEPLYLRAVHIFETVFGMKHPRVAASVNNLGQLYLRQGKYEEAFKKFQQAYNISLETLGASHSSTATVLLNLGEVQLKMGDVPRALQSFLTVLPVAVANFGAKHNLVSTCCIHIAELYNHVLRQPAQAIPYYEQGLESLKATVGLGHENTLQLMDKLSYLYQKLHMYDKAEDMQLQLAMAVSSAQT